MQSKQAQQRLALSAKALNNLKALLRFRGDLFFSPSRNLAADQGTSQHRIENFDQ
jgi:hypothetical protein